tara:strand:- start:8 stop:694 length:687 start_codon:yes stop_codon:yes gene_type:complete
MPRIAQKPASRGSQKWLQVAVSDGCQILSDPISVKLGLKPATIDWLSPCSDDDFAEYSDQAFLNRLGVIPDNRALTDFWPKRGPVWDGLGRSGRGDLLMVEAKAHIGEMSSPASQAGPKSLQHIRASLRETQAYLGVNESIDWSAGYYQYCNRLAHLYFLREINQLPAWLVFVYFVNDTDMSGPGTKEEWIDAIKAMKSALGLPENHLLSKYVIDLYLDVNSLLSVHP